MTESVATLETLARALEQAERALEVQPNHAATHALIEDLSSGLERRRAYLDRHLPNLATSTDRMELDSIAGACRAIGDRACEAAARQRARSLAPLRTD